MTARILVVDDVPANVRLLEARLSAEYFSVVTASGGAEALAICERAECDIVLLDVMMPDMDGFEVCRRIKANPVTQHLPVVMVTALDQASDRVKGLEAGADDFLTKPLDNGELVARLNVANRILETEEAVRRTNRELQHARQKEIELGATIQKRLLYTPPPRTTNAIETASLSIPSQHVDGDFCDFFTHGDNIVDVFVGDVMGKGVPAAMVGAGVKSGLQRCMISLLTQTVQAGLPSPDCLIQKLDELVCAELIDLGTFLTLCYARFDSLTDTLTYVNCGHPKIILWESLTGISRLQDTTNVPLGFSDSESYQQHSAKLAPGDLLLFYSDGVTDLKLPDGKRLGMAKFAEWVEDRGDLPLDEFLSEVEKLRTDGLTGTDTGDDFTCVVIRYRGTEVVRDGVLRLWADQGSLRKVRNYVKKVASDPALGFTPEEISALLLGVQEAASNVVRHSRPNHKGIPIEVRAIAENGWFTVDLLYPGDHFDPQDAPEPVLDGTREGGFGISIIKKCVDEVAYQVVGDQNLMTLRKRVNGLE